MGCCPWILNVHPFPSINVEFPLGLGHAFPFGRGLQKVGSPSELSQGQPNDPGVPLMGTRPAHTDATSSDTHLALLLHLASLTQ